MNDLLETDSQTSATQSLLPIVQAKGLCQSIDDRLIIRKIDLEIFAGSYVALLGHNGAGKSTLLRMLAMLTMPTQGTLELFGQTVRAGGAKLRARVGMIGHQLMLYRDLSLRENLIFFGKLYGLKKVALRADELLKKVRLDHRADDPARTLSRGMAQRLAIARALMHDPDLILADEPFSGLDTRSVAQIEMLLKQLHEAGKTIILVNHDIPQSVKLAERLVILKNGQVIMDQLAKKENALAISQEVVMR